MGEADVADLAAQVTKVIIDRHDAEAISSISFAIIDQEISKTEIDPNFVIRHADRTETAREFITYLVTRLLIRGHVDAGEIETRPDDFDLASEQGAEVVRALERRAGAEEH